MLPGSEAEAGQPEPQGPPEERAEPQELQAGEAEQVLPPVPQAQQEPLALPELTAQPEPQEQKAQPGPQELRARLRRGLAAQLEQPEQPCSVRHHRPPSERIPSW